VVGLLLAGGVYLAYLLVRHPEVLETEPSKSSALTDVVI
jgi:hypothetical protein